MERAQRFFVVAFGGTLAAFVVAWALVPLPDDVRTPLIDVLWLATSALATAAFAWAFRRPEHAGLRRPLGFLAAGAALWSAGQAVWTYQEVVADVAAPVFALADLGYSAAVPLLAAALLAWPRARTERDLVVTLDLMLVGGFALLFGLQFVLEPLLELDRGGWAALYAFVYPPAHVLLFAAVLAALILHGWRERERLDVAAAAILVFVVANTGYVYLGDAYTVGGLLDPAWAIAFAALGLTFVVPRERLPRLPERVRVFLPAWSLILLAFVGAVVHWSGSDARGRVDLVALLALLVLLAMRHGYGEIKLLNLARRHALVLDSAGEGIFALDRDGRVVFVNAAAARLVGWEQHELIGRSMHETVHHSHADATPYPAEQCPIRRASSGHAQQVSEEVFWRRDGSSFPVSYSASPRVEDGVVVGSTVVFSDVTQQRLLEEQLQHAQKLEAVGRLAGGVAHDFNNLLTAIQGYSDLALAGLAGDDPVRDDVEEVRRAADRAADLTRQLLAFSRRQVLAPRVVDLNAVVAGAERMLRRLIGEHVELVTQLEPDLVPVRADPGQIEQIVANLVVNARDAMPDGGTIVLETELVRRGRPHVRLAVSDSGTGIDAETRSRLFEPFFTTKEVGKGTGLGLAVVHGIVAQSGGEITVTSEVGSGTTFEVVFPLAEEPADETGAAAPAAAPAVR
ncbi:MAG TPA: ATP-binding protein [Gaiellaceae bacterium]|nr:ATP-binding protein [Gaiellaceae bacterium]